MIQPGDKVQIFGSVPLPEGGFPYRGSAGITAYDPTKNEIFLDATIEGIQPDDYVIFEVQ